MASMMDHVPQAPCTTPRHPMTPVRVELTIALARTSEPFPTRVFDDKWQNLNPRRRLVIEWTAQL